MAYGNDFGGVQAAQENQQRARASDYFNSVAATRAQQAQDAAIEQANRNYMLQQQQLVAGQAAQQQARRDRMDESAGADQKYILDFMTRQGDAKFNRDTTKENQDLQRSYFDMQKAANDQKLLTNVDQVTNQGAALASELGDAVTKRTDAAKNLGEMETYMAKLKQSALVNPQYKPHILSVLAGVANQATAARRDMVQSDYMFKKATSQAVNLGFIPQNGKLVHGRTGKSFDYLMGSAGVGNEGAAYNPSYLGSEEQFVDSMSAPRSPAPVAPESPMNQALSYMGGIAKQVADPFGIWQSRTQPRTVDVSATVTPSQPMGTSQAPGYLNQQRVKVVDRQGNFFTVPAHQLQEAMANGFTPAR